MKTRWMGTILLVTCLVLAGCSKKEPPAPPTEPSGTETPAAVNEMKEAAGQAVRETTEAAKEAVAAVKESFTIDVNLEKSIADLKAEAARMDVATLTEVAKKYKDAIMQKQGAMKTLTEQLAAIPLTEKMGTQAQNLTKEIKTLTDAIAPLKERLGVYVDAIKAKGGNVSGLTI